jgi:catechol 2,3-dioxygenase-like lactoylglutathione lyase family enzyme
MDYPIEVITLPVSDVDRAVRFCTERAGFVLDVDYRPNLDPERRSNASFIDFADPDGNTWIVQERGFTRTASTNRRRI